MSPPDGSPMGEVARRASRRALWYLLVLDLSLWILALVTRFAPRWVGLSEESLAWLQDRFQEAAIVFLITAVITYVFERQVTGKLRESSVEEFVKSSAAEFGRQTQDLSMRISPIVAATTNSSIESIFQSRGEPEAKKDINTELAHEKDEILLAGIGLSDFFHVRKADYFENVDKLLKDGRVQFRVLLLDPDSGAAFERSNLEGVYRTRREIRETCSKIDEYINDQQRNIERRFYTSRPIAFIVVTGRFLFIEQYHLGVVKDEENPPSGICIGGQVPLFKFASGSQMYSIAKAHFEYLWNLDQTSSPLDVSPSGFVQYRGMLFLAERFDSTRVDAQLDGEDSSREEVQDALNRVYLSSYSAPEGDQRTMADQVETRWRKIAQEHHDSTMIDIERHWGEAGLELTFHVSE